MGGIVAFVGHRPAFDVSAEGLRRLDYRGDDSAGVAVLADDRLLIGGRLQLFAYHCATLAGRDVDRPRNLAKSVTVE